MPTTLLVLLLALLLARFVANLRACRRYRQQLREALATQRFHAARDVTPRRPRLNRS